MWNTEQMCSPVFDNAVAMQDSVYGPGYNEPGFGKKPAAAGKKRAAPEDDPALKEALAEHDFKVERASDSQTRLLCCMTLCRMLRKLMMQALRSLSQAARAVLNIIASPCRHWQPRESWGS